MREEITFNSLLAGTALTLGSVLILSAPSEAATYDYSYYDADNDGYLEMVEYVDYSYDLIDYDNSNTIDRTEWQDYQTVWYDPYTVEYDTDYGFDYYDVDNDGYLEYAEYEEAYDPDLYDAWDEDDDGLIDDDEYETVGTTYVDYDDDGLYEW